MTLFKNIFNRYLRKNDKIQKSETRNTGKENISANLADNLQLIRAVLGNSSDIIIRSFKIASGQVDAFLLNLDGMVDQTLVSENIVKPLMLLEGYFDPNMPGVLEQVRDSVITIVDVKDKSNLNTVLSGVLAGDTALFIAGSTNALVLSTRGFESRGVQEPQTETVVRGPREGFSEPLRINTSLIRRRIKNPNLRLETIVVGKQTKTNICIAYLKGVCDEQIVQEVKNRLLSIETDSIFGAGNIEQFIEDAPYSIFLTVGITERPDVVAGKIMEGRVAIVIEGTPIVLTVPYLFVEGFQSAEDYLVRPLFATITRWLRYLAFLITVYLPPVYIALTTFHQEMIPTPLLITFAAAREGTPFPAFVEALGTGVVFEFIREAGVRMPRPVGQAVSIVGALVIGQAAVSAGLIGAPMVIVTSLTAITVFLVPSLLEVATVLRFACTLAAGVAGFYGILLTTLLIFIHATSLRSFGVPYISPIAPMTLKDLKDVLVKVPIWAMGTRPSAIGYQNLKRQSDGMKPEPPKKK